MRQGLLMLAVAYGAVVPSGAIARGEEFEGRVVPLMKRYCYECHGDGASAGELELDKYKTLGEAEGAGTAVWEKVIRYARSQVMPPPDAEAPIPQEERDRLVEGLQRAIYKVDPENPDPGPTVVRRLNRAEYRNTVRDLLGVKSDPTDDFPQDDTGYGFDTIGDVLTLPPMLMEKYLAAAAEVAGETIPKDPAAKGMPAGMKKLLEKHKGEDAAAARGVLGELVARAWRRPVEQGEVDRLVELYELARGEGEDHRGGLRHAITGVLVSPSFLFRGEVGGSRGTQAREVGEWELASRLSYFLWGSMPDGELAELARKGELRANMDAQVRRMLTSPKAAAFVENFAGQWLQFRDLDAVHPDARLFEVYDDRLRDAMRRETQLFFESIVREDRSLLEVLTADYTFVNERLAKHYGIKDAVKGEGFTRVSLAGTPRRGVLTHASVLTLTSNPTRTSPVKRGKWVLETLLGASPPPPPPDLPALDGDGGKPATGTVRQRLEKHREDPGCASCHAPMDPIGFGLENFDAVGRWRERDGKDPIDARSAFVGGPEFEGAAELVEVLAKTRRNDFYRAVTEAAMTFALGRGIEPYDQPAVDKVVAELRKDDGKLSTLVMGVVRSVPFQMRRGDESPRSGARAPKQIADLRLQDEGGKTAKE